MPQSSCLKVTFLFVSIIFPFCFAKVFEPCELAKAMIENYRFQKADIADWICLIRWESHYNTSAVGMLNADGSTDHGLFQISGKYWCADGDIGGACGLDCKSLQDDDIADDSVCARRIFRVTKHKTGNGFSAWAAWTQRCQNQEYKQSFIKDCNLE
ncbi:unnamed protein product [Orchesella dallaii]|uniref:lysozyme n=1 Tax=Orchesella dallaii TaxID=48710 RepID=A0ABP1QIT3_9HEXA